MLVIRLARTGRTKYPTYRIVAAESARAATGKFIDVLGHYNPHTKELVLQREAIEKRLSQGAQPSNTVVKLLQRENVELPKWVVLKTKAPKPVEVAEEATEAAAESDVSAEAETNDEAAADVSPAEAEADASGNDEVRVAEVAEEAGAEAEASAPNADAIETAESEAKLENAGE